MYRSNMDYWSRYDNNSSNSSGGIGFFGLLGILFIGLKLTGYIDWSWWWVLAPLYMPLIFIMIIGAIVVYYKKHKNIY